MSRLTARKIIATLRVIESAKNHYQINIKHGNEFCCERNRIRCKKLPHKTGAFCGDPEKEVNPLILRNNNFADIRKHWNTSPDVC